MSVSRVQHSASSGSSYQMRTSLPLHTFIRAAEEANDTPSVICHIDPAKAQRCSWGFIFSNYKRCPGRLSSSFHPGIVRGPLNYPEYSFFFKFTYTVSCSKGSSDIPLISLLPSIKGRCNDRYSLSAECYHPANQRTS